MINVQMEYYSFLKTFVFEGIQKYKINNKKLITIS